jgi:hypothetical protein
VTKRVRSTVTRRGLECPFVEKQKEMGGTEDEMKSREKKREQQRAKERVAENEKG